MKKQHFALTCALLLSTFALAHGNMEHVMGTVSEITTHSVAVKTTEGTVKTVEFDAATKFLKGDSAAAAGDVHVGDRVAIHAHQTDKGLHAAEIKIGAAAKAASK